MRTLNTLIFCTCVICVAIILFVGILAPKNTSRVVKDTNSIVMETSNAAIAKDVGGTATITLLENKKLQLVTWKGNNSLWLLYRPMRADEQAETYTYQENSRFGVLEATITIREVKTKGVQ